MADLDEMELKRLDAAVSAAETILARQQGEKNPVMVRFVENAKLQISFLEKKVTEAKAVEKEKAEQYAAAASQAQQEKALSEDERKTFGGFLEKEFFTKKDFGALEGFYSKTWDRLSENGKDAMSQRVWEGVRRDEYTFKELPTVVREKETERVCKRLRDAEIGDPVLTRIPAKDRNDLFRAYEGGMQDEAEKVLERESFKQNMFRVEESKVVEHAAAHEKRDGEKATLFAREVDSREPALPSEKAPEKNAPGEEDFSSLDMKVARTDSAVSPVNLPSSSASPRRGL